MSELTNGEEMELQGEYFKLKAKWEDLDNEVNYLKLTNTISEQSVNIENCKTLSYFTNMGASGWP